MPWAQGGTLSVRHAAAAHVEHSDEVFGRLYHMSSVLSCSWGLGSFGFRVLGL